MKTATSNTAWLIRTFAPTKGHEDQDSEDAHRHDGQGTAADSWYYGGCLSFTFALQPALERRQCIMSHY